MRDTFIECLGFGILDHTQDLPTLNARQAARLGDNADATAAICGQAAGAFYGESAIWLRRLVMREEIGNRANQLRVSNPTG